jgi:hypothetical protein
LRWTMQRIWGFASWWGLQYRSQPWGIPQQEYRMRRGVQEFDEEGG